MEPATTVAAGLAVLGTKDILTKILGPTADYIGGEMVGLVKKCNINLDNVFKNAIEKLGSRLDEPGEVSSRTLKLIIEEGRFCEDQLFTEYFGGILASSKTSNGRDDRGVAIISSIKVLSTYQLRLHYLIYCLVNNLFSQSNLEIGVNRSDMEIYIPVKVFIDAMDLTSDEKFGDILAHSITGLSRQGLIGSKYAYGNRQYLQKFLPEAWADGLLVRPNVQGAETFLWAHGLTDVSGHAIAQKQYDLGDPKITIPDGAIATSSKLYN